MKKFLWLLLPLWFSTASAELIDVDNKKLQELIDQGVPVIDIRRLDEWKKTGVIDGSHLITFFDKDGKYDAQKWYTEMSALINPLEPFVLICHSGARTAAVGQSLGKEFETVYNVKSGIHSWIQTGNKTVQMP